MATKLKIEFNTEGFSELLQSAEVKQLVEENAQEIANRAGGSEAGFEPSVYMSTFGGGRWKGSVWASTPDAMIDEAANKTLSKAVIG